MSFSASYIIPRLCPKTFPKLLHPSTSSILHPPYSILQHPILQSCTYSWANCTSDGPTTFDTTQTHPYITLFSSPIPVSLTHNHAETNNSYGINKSKPKCFMETVSNHDVCKHETKICKHKTKICNHDACKQITRVQNTFSGLGKCTVPKLNTILSTQIQYTTAKLKQHQNHNAISKRHPQQPTNHTLHTLSKNTSFQILNHFSVLSFLFAHECVQFITEHSIKKCQIVHLSVHPDVY